MTKSHSRKYETYKESGVEWLGNVPANWEISHLKRLSRKITDGAHTSPDLSSPDFPFLTVVNLNNSVLDFDNCLFTSRADYERLVRNDCQPEIFDVLYSKDGTIAETVVVNETRQFIVGSSFIIIRPIQKRVISKYLSYLLSSYIMRYQARLYVKGAGLTRISIFNISKLLVVSPTLPEQQAIADYLDAKTAQIDRKIDLLEQKAEKYADLKQSFINETVTRGLDKTIPIKDSGVDWIGQIPAHWAVYRIKDFSYVKGRIGWQGLRNSDFLDQGNYYCVTGTDLVNGSVDWSNCYYVSQERYDQDKFIQLKLGDLLITKDGTIGKVALVNQLPLQATLNSGVFVTRPLRKKYINEFMYWILNSSLFKDFIDLTKGGSTIQHLYQNVFDRFLYCCPPLSEQKNIAVYLDKKTSEIDAIIEKINAQVEMFRELRKTLINDVVTGKIKVYEETIHE